MFRHCPRLGFGGAVLAALLAVSAPVADAGTILLVSGGSNGGGMGINTVIYDGTVQYCQWLGISFTLTQPYSNVAVTPTLGSFHQFGDFSGTAWLTTSLSTDPALASAPFTIDTADSTARPRTLLAGLNLGPGTYYFLLTGNPDYQLQDPHVSGYSGEAFWPNLVGSTSFAASGVEIGTLGFVSGGFDLSSPPNSGWYFYGAGNPLTVPVEITGDPVPDPGSTLLLLGMSLTGLFAAKRRRR